MPLLYFQMAVYSAMLDVMFKNWGTHENRATIIASEPEASDSVEVGATEAVA